jgi:predicted 3-demethylubiquinone-9 3-methyltransferase (glyoxalase superfamily)
MRLCKDKWRWLWQITPRVLTETAMANGGEVAKRVFQGKSAGSGHDS